MNVKVLQDTLEGSGASTTSAERGAASVTPVEHTEPDEAWFDDPDAHLTEVVDYMKRLHLRCDTADEFVGALKGVFPDLREKVDRSLALQEELRDLDDDELPDPDDDIAAGRSIIYLSGAEMIAADLAEELEDSIPGAGD